MRVSYLGTSESRAFIDANSVQIPLYMESVSAGFPSPALFPYCSFCQCAEIF